MFWLQLKLTVRTVGAGVMEQNRNAVTLGVACFEQAFLISLPNTEISPHPPSHLRPAGAWLCSRGGEERQEARVCSFTITNPIGNQFQAPCRIPEKLLKGKPGAVQSLCVAGMGAARIWGPRPPPCALDPPMALHLSSL